MSFKLFLDRIFLYHNNNQLKILYGKKSTVRDGSDSSGILQHHAIFIIDEYNNIIYKIHIVGDTGTSSHEGVTKLNITEEVTDTGAVLKATSNSWISSVIGLRIDYSGYHCYCIGHTNINIYKKLKLQHEDGIKLRNKSRFTCHDFAWYIVETYTNKSDLIPVNLLLSGCIRWQHYVILLSIFLVFIQVLNWWLLAVFILIFKFYECYLHYDIQCALNNEIYSIKSFIKCLYDLTDDDMEQLSKFIITMKYFSLGKDLRNKLFDALLTIFKMYFLLYCIYLHLLFKKL